MNIYVWKHGTSVLVHSFQCNYIPSPPVDTTVLYTVHSTLHIPPSTGHTPSPLCPTHCLPPPILPSPAYCVTLLLYSYTVTLCYTVLHSVTLCYAVVHYFIQCYTVLYCVILCYTLLHCGTQCNNVSHCVILCYTVLCCVTLYYTILHYIAL